MFADRIGPRVAELAGDGPPQRVARRTLQVIWDLVACAFAAGARGIVGRGAGGGGPAQLLGAGGVAFELAWRAARTDLDETNFYANQHVALHVVPAALAVAGPRGLTVAETVSAVTVGYELAAQFGARAAYPNGAHSHGGVGVVGGAVAATLLLGGDAACIARTIRLAGSSLAVNLGGAREAGAWGFYAYTGMAAERAVRIASLALDGVDGDPTAFGSTPALLRGIDEAAVLKTLGSDFFVLNNFVKFHPCCADVSVGVDAVVAAVGELPPSQIEEIVVATFPSACEFPDPDKVNRLTRGFCLPIAVATRLIGGDCRGASLSVRERASISDLARRIRCVVDKAAERSFPAVLSASVTVTAKNASQSQLAYRVLPTSRLNPGESARWNQKVGSLLDTAGSEGTLVLLGGGRALSAAERRSPLAALCDAADRIAVAGVIDTVLGVSLTDHAGPPTVAPAAYLAAAPETASATEPGSQEATPGGEKA